MTFIQNNGGGYSENLLYQDPIKELQTMLNTYNDKYLLYPYNNKISGILIIFPPF